jgi:hypothetical protein
VALLYPVLTTASVVGGRKNTQIYTIKRAKKICSRKCNSQDLLLGEEHTVLRQKLNFFPENTIYSTGTRQKNRDNSKNHGNVS